jgi:hypothetical protein
MSEQRCPICGKRYGYPKHTKRYETEAGAVTVNFYVTNHTEPICQGHRIHDGLLVDDEENSSRPAPYGISAIERLMRLAEKDLPGEEEQVAIPQAFYDAFADEEEI